MKKKLAARNSRRSLSLSSFLLSLFNNLQVYLHARASCAMPQKRPFRFSSEQHVNKHLMVRYRRSVRVFFLLAYFNYTVN